MPRKEEKLENSNTTENFEKKPKKKPVVTCLLTITNLYTLSQVLMFCLVTAQNTRYKVKENNFK